MRLLTAVIAVRPWVAGRAGFGAGSVPGLVYTAGYGNSSVARYDPLSSRAAARESAGREREQLELVSA